MISLAGGMPQPQLFDVEGIRRATLETLQHAPSQALQYGPTEGQESLRRALAVHLSQRAIRVSPDSIQVTTGSQQALDLIARAFLDEGDRVALEVPTYLAAVQAFDLRGAQYLEIPAAADGAAVDSLESALTADRGNPVPKLAYVVSNFANPSGASLKSVERRLALLRWAVARRVFLLEDQDPLRGLAFPRSRCAAVVGARATNARRRSVVRLRVIAFENRLPRDCASAGWSCPHASPTR